MESLETIQTRHRKEQRELQARITNKKKNATKKTRKGVNDECAELERQLKERQERELAALNGDAGAGAGDTTADDGPDEQAGEEREEVDGQVNGTRSTDVIAQKLKEVRFDEPPEQQHGSDSNGIGQGEQQQQQQGKKRNRQKERMARRAAEQEAAAAAAEQEAANMTDHREVEKTYLLKEFKAHGLVEQEIRPDGHCLFSAVADQLLSRGVPLWVAEEEGEEGVKGKEGIPPYKLVRKKATEYMEAHADDFAPFLEEPLEAYTRKMRDTAEWGGQLELQALANAYGVEIKVLQDGRTETIEPSDMGEGKIPIRDVQVSSVIPNSFMRGIAATVGTPPQDLILLPWPELNNTWIYNQGFCDAVYIWNYFCCLTRRGGYYLESESTTWVKANDITLAGGAPIEAETQRELGIGKLITSSLGGTDKFTFNTTGNLVDFPVGLPTMNWDDGPTMLHAMGMGTNSTILNVLFQTRRIGSRVWSMFWCRIWAALDGSSLDGSVVFGGYDQQKTAGKGYTQPLDSSEDAGCSTGMAVQISKLTLHNFYVETADLLESSTRIMACIVPQHELLLNGPASIIDSFQDSTGLKAVNYSHGLHRGASQYNISEVLGGDLTISLSMGLDIRVPSNQFLVPLEDIDDGGSRVVDTQQRELLIGTLTSSKTATLGRYFLTSAYLMVDLDANSFTLWQANPTTDSKLVGVGNTGCGDTTPPNPGTGAAPRLSGGSIAGIVVGVTVGTTVLGLVTRPPNLRDEASRLSELPVLDSTKPLHHTDNELHGSPAAVSEVNGQARHI
ncbi:aspartic peptidase domain-containing protein [Annulohypoxylon truncatum]|uniref:aspartic peptidase domain-containing protein n=1 Tax=Annulohypoxylon truncatum TaxID=327061 RepID=UPI0020075B73|nr:aspartic peptidase domain-containing protein [Annulohypoxylon truncatum]KAI1204291.1 aspartic peptidase domain-containing protein [Annulohypoxylon truncatum]